MVALPDPLLLSSRAGLLRHAPTGAWLRRLGPGDGAALLAHLLALSEWDRVARWHGARGDAAIAEECAALELAPGGRHLMLGGFTPDGALAGAALGVRLGAELEVAVTVAAAWRRRGLGTALVAALLRVAAQDRAARRAVFHLGPENVPMRRILLRLGGRIDAERCAEITLPG